MNRKGVIPVVMSAAMVLPMATAIHAEDKMDVNISKEISDSKKLVFGNFFGTRYRLNDKKIQEKIGEIIESGKIGATASDKRIKTYDFVIETDNYSIEMMNKMKNGKMCFMISENKNGLNYVAYESDKNIYEEIIKLLNESPDVEVESGYRNSINDLMSAVRESVEISGATFGRSENAVLVGKDSISDALCSASLAGYLKAPIILSDKDTLNEDIVKELERLHAKNIYTTSGNNVISKKVKDELTSKGYKLIDISGSDRYETSNMIAKKVNKGNSFIVASGENFNDIPSISPYAYENSIPILLTRKNSMPENNFNMLNKNSEVLAVGGYETVGKGVYKQIEKKNIKLKRIAGTDRFDTSKLIAKELYPNAKNFIYEADNNVIENIATAPMSAKYKKPILIIKDFSALGNVDEANNYFIYNYNK